MGEYTCINTDPFSNCDFCLLNQAFCSAYSAGLVHSHTGALLILSSFKLCHCRALNLAHLSFHRRGFLWKLEKSFMLSHRGKPSSYSKLSLVTASVFSLETAESLQPLSKPHLPLQTLFSKTLLSMIKPFPMYRHTKPPPLNQSHFQT